ncbi:VOC family protein [Hyphobacterium sp.]|uniref:VOC family protein n=1 Tax=Hyphobacterium sp. TaxID=2004662 RepID=UPI003BAA32E2
MPLGAFSVSLAVKDIEASKKFYEILGFTTMGGDQSQGWLILKNGDTILGLFQGMFEKNTLTFNPGWDQDANNLDEFEDVRALQQKFKDAGLDVGDPIDPESSGPAHFALTDPDGNPVLIDQHR